MLIVVFLVVKGISFVAKAIIFQDYYISSDTNEVTLYEYDKENQIMTDVNKIYRGTKVKSNDKTKTIEDIKYTEIKIDNKVFYVKKNSLVKNENKIVKETIKYVRTSVTVYKNETESKILSTPSWS